MIPSNPLLYVDEIVVGRLVNEYLVPDNITSADNLTDYEQGGVASQNTSKGLLFQRWKGYWNSADKTCYILPENSTTPTALVVEPDVVEFTFTFDQNMRWACAVLTSTNVVRFHWFDSEAAAYVVSTYSGASSVKLCLDDKRRNSVRLGQADIIITYIDSLNHLKWRIQRDRFLTEYSNTAAVIPTSHQITNFGLARNNRLQWRIGPKRLGM